ncbi:hypothetical protein GGR50DRAFT_269979 [Xylaria sp. CBS 124048]|nr:hypothetical protein GGR50DRAFT_269979 [Xylaria sp. CBS 124048]
MPSRSRNRHTHHDDPYLFDDPYIKSTPVNNRAPSYEYVGTDEYPPSPHHERPGRRHARTISPPRQRSRRHEETRTPPPPPSFRPSRHHSPAPTPRSKDREPRPREIPKRSSSGLKRRSQDFVEQNPKLQRYGKQGLNWLGKAAVALAAANETKDAVEPRSRSLDPRHSRRRSPSSSPSPSPSPSPPPARSRRHHSRDQDRDRRRRYSESPPPSNYRGRDRGRGRHYHHHQHPASRRASPSVSPSPSPPRHPRHSRSRRPSPPHRRNSTAPPPTTSRSSRANAELWQNAARAALEAGGITAFRLRKEPGSWTGDKAAKIASAALGAAAIDAFAEGGDGYARSKSKSKSKSRSKSRGGVRGMAENAISGFIASKLVDRGGKGGKRRGRE